MTDAIQLLAIFLMAGAGAWFASYLREKGKNYATKEDIHTITKLAEEIKADIGSKSWVAQRRWDLKRDLYWDIIKRFSEVSALLFDMGYHAEHGIEPTKEISERFDREWDQILAMSSLMRVVLPDDAFTAFDKLFEILPELSQMLGDTKGTLRDSAYYQKWVSTLDVINKAVADALRVIVDCAKRDLLTVMEAKT